jgi:hypothetical protein
LIPPAIDLIPRQRPVAPWIWEQLQTPVEQEDEAPFSEILQRHLDQVPTGNLSRDIV